MRKLLIIFFILIALPALVWFFFLNGNRFFPVLSLTSQIYTIHVGELPIRVEIADTQEKRAKGLSERSALAPNSGMLFVFDTVDTHGIWMRGMQFPIDILWLSENGTIVNIKRDVGPETFPEVFRPHVPTRYVLEVEANLTEIYGIKIGNLVRLGAAAGI